LTRRGSAGRVDGGSAALDRERFAQRGHFGSELGALDS
jgi:hypothetical protein